ncbi:Disease resistance protein [Cinnamomum micranthum f. kanehirae]|uniref:Disease resistance protein n=1 Tax=Cinnamomum micranthum f. kanehirae TaxID=337451 RepID=A0A3S3QHF6_9MAGN|nr:Disease resistance protein [Cinnamomum micranthum f. kanehirae]
MAGSAVDYLVTTLGNLLLEEASLLGGLHSNLDDIRLELQSIQSFLKDSDRKKDSNEGVRTWVGQVREVAYDVEDIIDEFMYRMTKNNFGTRGVIYNTICFPRCCFYTHQIATQLQQIKSKITDIYARGMRYGFVEEASSSRDTDAGENKKSVPESVHFVPDNEIVGIDYNKSCLIRWLKDKEPRRMVLSVVGMGGLGKTTLVTKAYNSEELKDCFDCRACITISQSYKIMEILRSLIKELYKSNEAPVPHNIGQMSYVDLVSTLIAYLQPSNSIPKRYVIVLDDVWDTNVWQDIKVALPDSECGSRVMLTTRKEDVASSLGVGSRVIHLEPLCSNSSWDLFCNRAFWNHADKRCPPELNSYAQSLVHKCEGLPLAIVSIGGLMSLKEKTTLEWKKVEVSLNWELSNNPNLERMKNLLLHSFNDLPYSLKRCFLYCSLFPEDHIIRRKKLIRLWIAEGFVEERRGLTLEEVADAYLKELICRNMLQDREMDDYWRSTSFRMHDLLRELALSIATEENFCMIYNSELATQDRNARRLSIQNSNYKISQGRNMDTLRTFFSFAADVVSSSSSRSTIRAFRLLRVLDLQASLIERIPDELTDLFNLRYLSIRDTNVKGLPESLGKLKNLQTLDLRNTKVERLPKGVEKMKQLRHLYLYRYTHQAGYNFVNGIQAPPGICKLISLQSVVTVEASDEIIRQVGNLTQLTKFEIVKVRGKNGMQLCTSIEKMKRLLHLHVMAADEGETLQLESMSSPPPLLQKLILTGHLKTLPPWIANLGDLPYLSLRWSRISEDIFSSLKAMSNLVFLRLVNAYEGKHLLFYAGCFPKLKVLTLSSLKYVDRIQIEEKAMPCLQLLRLIDCGKLKMLPQGIESLSELQKLYLRSMPKELIERIEGDDLQKPVITKESKLMGALLTLGTWQQDAGDKQEALYLQLVKTEVELLKVWMANFLGSGTGASERYGGCRNLEA